MTLQHDLTKKINHKWEYLDKKEYIFTAEIPLNNEYYDRKFGLTIPGSNKKGKLIIKIDSKRPQNMNYTFNEVF